MFKQESKHNQRGCRFGNLFFQCHQTMNTNNIKKVLQILSSINDTEESGYSMGKNTIKRIFESLDTNSKDNIIAKLTLIDSMYSTQMNRRYYGLEELSDVLAELQKKCNLSTLFLNFLKDKDIEKLTIQSGGKIKNLFKENYGIGKDGNDKGQAVSLISKYAYFETNFQFPIYDSIVREMYPLIWQYCDFPKREMPKMSTLVNDIVVFIEAIDFLKEKLGNPKQLTYDNLDRLLWHTGKILRGNLSLILTMEEYQKYGREFQEKNFDFSKYDLSKMTFLRQKPMLKGFFEFAKELSTIKM